MPENYSPNDSPLVVAMREFFAPLANKTSELPAPLAYGLAIVLAVLVIVLMGAVIPNELIWLLGVIVFVCLVAFVFIDWDTRRSKLKKATKSNKRNDTDKDTCTVYIIVHKIGDETAYISGAQVKISLPEPQMKLTQSNGSATFPTILSKYVGESFPVNASADGYERRDSIEWVIEDGGYLRIALTPLPESPAELEDVPDGIKVEGTLTKIQLTQVKPETDSPVYESTTGRITLGRNDNSDVLFPADTKSVSWRHGLISLMDDAYYYHHLSKSSSTAIHRRGGESRLFRAGEDKKYPLCNQDRLVLGEYEFVVAYDIIGINDGIWTPTDQADEETKEETEL
jgi:hypothetical protein